MKNPPNDRRPPASDPDQGIWQGQSIARCLISPDGMIVLVGRGARDNDTLSFRLSRPEDFWFHVASESGSHVIVKNPDMLEHLPRTTLDFAAGLAAGYSKARRGGRVAVHMTTCAEVKKPRGLPAGKVQIRRFRTVHASPLRSEDLQAS